MSIDFSNAYKINSSDNVFLDTNILIFLFSPDFVSSNDYQVDTYSKIFEILVEKQNNMYVNSLVISEFLNRCLRIDFNKNFQVDNNAKHYKNDYRGSKEYKQTLKILLKLLHKMLNVFKIQQLDDGFSKFETITEFEKSDELDFNDLVISRTVLNQNLKLLSDDRDFDNYEGINTKWYL